MTIKKNIHKLWVLCILLISLGGFSQKISAYKIGDLLRRIHNESDTIYVVNFWATWCKPCVTELPEFEKLNRDYKTKQTKILLVSLDFKEDLEKKLKSFLEKNNYTSEVVLLNEVNGNDFINKIMIRGAELFLPH